MCSVIQKEVKTLKKKLVSIKTVENVCQAFLALSPIKKEKAKTYIMGMMDNREAAEYEKTRQQDDSPAA